jgi:hypothetical protein
VFEKMSTLAEKLATNVSESRRGFLVRTGRVALGVAGAVGGLLALPADARATTFGQCQTLPLPGQLVRLTGWCVGSDCSMKYTPSLCRGYGAAPAYLCGKKVTYTRNCWF